MRLDEQVTALSASSLAVGYQSNNMVFDDLNVSFPKGKLSVIIGPNGCGKSTLLKTMAQVLALKKGKISVNGQAITKYARKEFAKLVSFLPQKNSVPSGILVNELISRGRYVHQTFFQQWSKSDEQALEQALIWTGLSDLTNRPLEGLSGGQQQRAWIALVLAQQTPIILLDEPTTYLDIGHQHEILQLCKWINEHQQRTFVLVLHDLNQAARYADYIVAMKDGKILSTGSAQEVINEDNIAQLFNLNCKIIQDPVSNTPLILPQLSNQPGAIYE